MGRLERGSLTGGLLLQVSVSGVPLEPPRATFEGRFPARVPPAVELLIVVQQPAATHIEKADGNQSGGK